MDTVICVGKILSPFGIGGLVRLKSYTDPKENIFKFPSLFHQENNDLMPLVVTAFRSYQSIFLVNFSRIENRSLASNFKNKFVFIKKTYLPPTPTGEFYWEDLKGFSVINKNKFEFGKVAEFIETGGKDVMRIVGVEEFFIPFVWDYYILSVNREQKIILVDWDSSW